MINENEVKVVLATLRKLAAVVSNFAPDFGKQEVAEAWCENLQDFTLTEIGIACKAAVSSCRTFPSISEFRAFVGRKKATDEEVASECVEAILAGVKMGFEAQVKAHETMGQLAWDVAMKCGSWWDLCYNTNLESADFIKRTWKTTALNHIRQVKSGTVGQQPQLDSSLLQALESAREGSRKLIEEG